MFVATYVQSPSTHPIHGSVLHLRGIDLSMMLPTVQTARMFPGTTQACVQDTLHFSFESASTITFVLASVGLT